LGYLLSLLLAVADTGTATMTENKELQVTQMGKQKLGPFGQLLTTNHQSDKWILSALPICSTSNFCIKVQSHQGAYNYKSLSQIWDLS
jgi:hypothetical protein